jgi:hypothetical protein
LFDRRLYLVNNFPGTVYLVALVRGKRFTNCPDIETRITEKLNLADPQRLRVRGTHKQRSGNKHSRPHFALLGCGKKFL